MVLLCADCWCSCCVVDLQEFVNASYWDASPWFVKLGVRLLCEQRKGAASPFTQWIQQLPQQVRHSTRTPHSASQQCSE
jgi:hypothetical protein